MMNSFILKKIESDLNNLIYNDDSDNRGMSDHMLFYFNTYYSIKDISRLKQYKKWLENLLLK